MGIGLSRLMLGSRNEAARFGEDEWLGFCVAVIGWFS
jgi:hypothetical protein